MPETPTKSRITTIRKAQRIWVVGAIHGDHLALQALHDQLIARLQPGDKLVYSGNFFGYGDGMIDVIWDLLHFRRWFLSHPPFVHPDDCIFLRGWQEEMLAKAGQIHFARDPESVLGWMLSRGFGATLRALGLSSDEALLEAGKGVVALTQWTTRLRDAIRMVPGLQDLLNSLAHAAVTSDGRLLFVNSGLDISKDLAHQGDSFWWAAQAFDRIDQPYSTIRRVVRGFDPQARGLDQHAFRLSLDAGAGRGGKLLALCLLPEGAICDQIMVEGTALASVAQ